MSKEFLGIETALNILRRDKKVSTSDCVEVNTNSAEKKLFSRGVFKKINLMYTIDLQSENHEINNVIFYNSSKGRKPAEIKLISNFYINNISNDNEKFQQDYILRYQYIKANDALIEKELKKLIIKNLEYEEYEMIAIDSCNNIVSDENTLLINEAIIDNKQIAIYTHRKDQISPLKLYFYNGYWYLAFLTKNGYCKSRTFDSIKHIEMLDESIIHSKELMQKFRSYKWDAYGHEKSDKKCTIVLKIDEKYIFNYFLRKKFHATQQEFLEYENKNGFFVVFKFNIYEEIGPTILSWIDVITIYDIICENDKEDSFINSLHHSIKDFITKNEHKQYFKRFFDHADKFESFKN